MSNAAETSPPSVDDLLADYKATLEQGAGVAELAERLFGHVLRTFDLDALFRLEQVLWSEIHRLGIRDDSGELADALLAQALFQVAHSSDRHVITVPVDITPIERIAVEYDEDCYMCRAELAEARAALAGPRGDAVSTVEDEDDRELEAQAAAAWRLAHADTLRRFGLA